VQAYAMILNAYAGKGDAPKTFALLAKFEQQGLVIDKAHITTVLLEALLKSSQFEANMMKRKRSRHLFTRFEENPYASMTSVERCRAGWVLWANMRRHGIVPLGKTFMNMLRVRLIDGFRVYVLSCMNWRLFIYIFFHGFS
jgi:hypothetical protein